MTAFARRTVLAALALAPTGCVSLLPASNKAPQLFRLTAASDFPAQAPHVSWQLLVDTPQSPAALDSDRIALSRSPTTVDYFADAAWDDRAPTLVQSLLVQSFENSGRITAIARESLALREDYVLRPELRHFEAVYDGDGPPTARVLLAAKLVKMPERVIVARHSADTATRASANRVDAVVEAFDTALHQALRETVDWALEAGR